MVSKEEKDDLKALNIGARWHKDELKWSVPLDADLSKVPAKWLPNSNQAQNTLKNRQKRRFLPIFARKIKNIIKTTVFPRFDLALN